MAKSKKKRKTTVETYETRKLEFREVMYWDDLQEVARQILDEDKVPADATVYMDGGTIEVTGQW